MVAFQVTALVAVRIEIKKAASMMNITNVTALVAVRIEIVSTSCPSVMQYGSPPLWR